MHSIRQRDSLRQLCVVPIPMSDEDVSHQDCELIKLNLDQSRDDSEEDDGNRERLRLLKIRKKQELKLIKRFDKSTINVAKECWFLVDSDWLNKWSAFVNGGEAEDSPGVLSTRGMSTQPSHEKGTHKYRRPIHKPKHNLFVILELLDAQDNPLMNLNPIRDYRGVPPVVYFIFLELYGKDSSPELCRYQIDIYKPPVSVAKLVNIQLTGRVSGMFSFLFATNSSHLATRS